MAKIRDMEDKKVVPNNQYAMCIDLVTCDAKMKENYPKKVKVNPYNVCQMKKMVYGKGDNYSSMLADIVDSLIDVDVRQLTLIDYDKILLFLRINSCGSSILEYNVKCDKCEKYSPFKIDLSTLDIKAVPSAFSEPQEMNNELSLILPRLGAKLEFDEMSEKLDLIDYQALYIEQGNTFKEKLEIYNSLSPQFVTKEFHTFISSVNSYGIDTDTKHVCSVILNHETVEKCGAEEVLHIPFRRKFFFPNYI